MQSAYNLCTVSACTYDVYRLYPAPPPLPSPPLARDDLPGGGGGGGGHQVTPPPLPPRILVQPKLFFFGAWYFQCFLGQVTVSRGGGGGGTQGECLPGALPLYQVSYLEPQVYPHLGKSPK